VRLLRIVTALVAVIALMLGLFIAGERTRIRSTALISISVDGGRLMVLRGAGDAIPLLPGEYALLFGPGSSDGDELPVTDLDQPTSWISELASPATSVRVRAVSTHRFRSRALSGVRLGVADYECTDARGDLRRCLGVVWVTESGEARGVAFRLEPRETLGDPVVSAQPIVESRRFEDKLFGQPSETVQIRLSPAVD